LAGVVGITAKAGRRAALGFFVNFSTDFCGKQFVGMYRPALPPIDNKVQPAAAIKQLDFIPCVVVFISYMHIK